MLASVETLDYQDHFEEFYCNDFEEAREKLKEVAACEDFHRRQCNSHIREITLKMPAEILKVQLVIFDDVYIRAHTYTIYRLIILFCKTKVLKISRVSRKRLRN